MNPNQKRSLPGLIVLAALAWLVCASAATAQVEEAHLRIDGMT